MKRTDRPETDRCPKAYLAWTFVCLGMVLTFACYAVYFSVGGGLAGSYAGMDAELTPVSNEVSLSAGGAALSGSAVGGGSLVLTEHLNEEDDYEKPVCKRLEESGERYNQEEEASAGGS